MTSEEIKEITLAEPNKPFALHLADGRVVNVLTRDHVAFRAGTRLLFAWDSEGKPHFLDAALITGLTGLGPA